MILFNDLFLLTTIFGLLGVSTVRFGKLTIDDLRSAEQSIFLEVGTVHFVNVEGVKGITGHAHFRTNRNVLSDISILIQQGATPGSKARPLNNIEGNFWTIPEDYPLNRR